MYLFALLVLALNWIFVCSIKCGSGSESERERKRIFPNKFNTTHSHTHTPHIRLKYIVESENKNHNAQISFVKIYVQLYIGIHNSGKTIVIVNKPLKL